MDKVDHVAAAPGPLACPSRGARPLAVIATALGPVSVFTKPNPKYIIILLQIVEIEGLSWPQRLAP